MPCSHTRAAVPNCAPMQASSGTNLTHRIRVSIKSPEGTYETYAIPCIEGPNGTPRTVGWLVSEAERRYYEVYRHPVRKKIALSVDLALYLSNTHTTRKQKKLKKVVISGENGNEYNITSRGDLADQILGPGDTLYALESCTPISELNHRRRPAES